MTRASFIGRDHHRHAVALHVWMLVLGGPVLLDLDQQPVEDGPAELHVGHLASAEPDDALDLVAVLEETDHVVLLEVEVVLVDAGAELHLLDHDHLLLLLRLVLLLLLLELVLPVVHDLADRRVGGRRDLDEVEVLLSGHVLRLLERDDSDLRSVVADEANLRDSSDQVIDSRFWFCGSTVESRSSSWWENTEVLLFVFFGTPKST